MAEIVLVEACSHSPFLFMEPHQWNQVRAARPPLTDNPVMSEEENAEQHKRCMDAFEELRQKMEEAKPDVILVFGDDQQELFQLDNFPAFGIFVGDEFEGYRTSARTGFIPGEQRGWREKTPETWVTVQSHPQLAQELAVGLTHRDFDISFSFEIPNKEHGMGHAFMRPFHRIVPNFDIPMIPFFVNCYFGPQPSANRCYRLGKATREVIEASPLDLRVAILGSGGLWHTPGSPTSWLNTEFDERILSYIPTGDAKGMADTFDAEGATPPADYSPKTARWIDGGTGMYTGIGSGTGETRNWVVAAGAADGKPGVVLDYVPVFSSPCGMGFAYWDL